MQVYSALYKIKNGCLPKSAKLYFMNELHNAKATQPAAILQIPISGKEIDNALTEFDMTAAQIKKSCEEEKWDCPTPNRAREIKDTCAICDFRWSCFAWRSKQFPMSYP